MLRRFLVALGVLLGLASGAFAQALVQQSNTKLDAATAVAIGNAALTANTAATSTITVPAGQYCYITAIGIDVAQNATSTAFTPTNSTAATGIAGAPQWTFACPATANSNCVGVRENFSVPLKGQAAGTNCVVTLPALGTNVVGLTRVYYYLAP